jgi:hypothetical protein
MYGESLLVHAAKERYDTTYLWIKHLYAHESGVRRDT